MALATEPRDWQLDEDNDLVIDTDLHFTTGVDAVVQAARIALQMFRGEWFLDLDAGIPYWDSILGNRRDIAIAIARDEFRSALKELDDVLEVIRLDVEFDGATRIMSITWQVSTSFGETPVDVLDLEIG
jgi:hypothetical protein